MRMFPLLAFAGVVTILVLQAMLRFDGLKDPSVMDAAASARRIAQGAGFVSTVMRPGEIARRDEYRLPAGQPPPETGRAPLHPYAIAAALRISGTADVFAVPGTTLFKPETHAVLPLALACMCLALALLAGLGIIFERHDEAALAMLTAACAPAFRQALVNAGPETVAMPAVVMLWVLAAWAARRPDCRILPAVAGIIAAVCLLAGAAAWPAVAAAGLFMVWNRPEENRTRGLLLFACAALLPPLCWGWRLWSITGNPLGSAAQIWADGTLFYPQGLLAATGDDIWRAHRAMTGIYQRGVGGFFDAAATPRAALLWLTFAAAGLAGRRLPDSEARLTACILAGSLLSAFLNAALGFSSGMLIWLPLQIFAGINALMHLLDGGGLLQPPLKNWWSGVLVLVAVLPFMIELREPRRGHSYPPFHPGLQAAAVALATEEDAICTDIPEAVTWYTGRPVLLLPRSPHDLPELAEKIPVSAVYLTQVSHARFIGGSGRRHWYGEWLPVLQGRVPENWPWRHGIHLPPETSDQVIVVKTIRINT